MNKQVFLYFFIVFLIIQIGFYLSNGLERTQLDRGFIKCWTGSHVKGRPEWRAECTDPTWSERFKDLID